MEKLGQLRRQADEDGSWDLIVVDTPPSRSALDFLDAPKRLGSFLDGRFIRILSAPAKGAGRGVGRVFGVGFGLVAPILNRILGTQLLTDVSAFVQALDTIFGGFRARADATFRLLQEPGTAFVVVAAPETDAIREATYFVDRLASERMPLAGLVLNRVTLPPAEALSAEEAIVGAETLEDADTHPVTAALLRMHATTVRTAARQRRLAERFTAAHPRVGQVVVPALADDVHDLEGLREIGRLVSGEG